MSSGINEFKPMTLDEAVAYTKSQVREIDPLGLKLSVPGAKADAGKVRMGLMQSGFPLALRAVAEITTHGAKKYTPGGWRHVPGGYERYYDAQTRHQNYHDAGELIDPDFGCYHLAHEAWNSLAKLELFLLEQKSRERNPEKPPGV